MNSFLANAEIEFNDYKSSKDRYAKKVNRLSATFGLNSPYNLRSDLPVFWSGNLDCKKEKIAVVEINPQCEEKLMTSANNLRSSNWQSYVDYHITSFLYLKCKTEEAGKYYRDIASVLSGSSFKDNSYFDFLQATVLRFELIPYASETFNPAMLESEADEYLFGRFNKELLPFVSQSKNIKKMIVHNKRMHDVLLKREFITPDDMVYVRMNKGRNHDFIYRKKYKGLDLFVFSRQIRNGGFSKEEVCANIF